MRRRTPFLRVRAARSRRDVAIARRLIRAYRDSLGIDLGFQHFDRELRELPGDYRPPKGDLWLAWRGRRAVGCVALRPLDRRRAEMKRLYVSPRERGRGLGRRLARATVNAAARKGYRWIYLDTLSTMTVALRLYEEMGFERIRPYRFNPIPGSRFLRRKIGPSRPIPRRAGARPEVLRSRSPATLGR